MKVLEKSEKKILQDGRYRDITRYLDIELQKIKISKLEDDIQIQIAKILSIESLLEVELPRMLEYYRVKILEKNTMLEEANMKKVLGRA